MPYLLLPLEALRAIASGDRAAALAALEQMDVEQEETDPEFLYVVGVWFVQVGKHERGLSLIEMAVGRGFFCFPWTVRDALLDPLRTTAAFQKLLAKVEARHRDARAAFSSAGGYEVLALTPSAG